MDIAYVRVSTIDQNEERQIESLKKYNIEKWFIEKESAKDRNRPIFNQMLDFAREGDTIYVSDFSRLARSSIDLLNIVSELEAKGIKLFSEKENFDTSTATGRLMLTMMAAINEFERINLLERQKEGIAIAKAKGKYKGRSKIERPSNFEEVYNKWKSREITGVKAMELLNLKKTMFYKFIKEHEESLVTRN